MLSSTMSQSIADAASSMAQTKDDDVLSYQLPAYIGPIMFLVDSLTYFIYYYLSKELSSQCKNRMTKYLLIFSVVLSIIGPILGGSRGASVVKFISFLFILYFVYTRKLGSFKLFKIPLRIKVGVVSSIALIGVLWSSIGDLLGRTSQEAIGYVFAIYCGAEIKNLDSYISERKFATSKQFGHETFYGFYLYTNAAKNRKVNSREKLDLPYRTEGGMPLGNVYTCFYPFIHDFGYIGIPILTILMGIICSVVWNEMLKPKPTSIIFIFLYSIISFGLLFSFFSNKFFESLVSFRLIKIVLFWFFLIWLMNYYKMIIQIKFKLSDIFKRIYNEQKKSDDSCSLS